MSTPQVYITIHADPIEMYTEVTGDYKFMRGGGRTERKEFN